MDITYIIDIYYHINYQIVLIYHFAKKYKKSKYESLENYRNRYKKQQSTLFFIRNYYGKIQIKLEYD
jgi:hypothetical protein